MANQHTQHNVPMGRSFAEVYPELVHEWAEENTVTPHQVYAKSAIKRFWKCSLGHLYELSPQHKSQGVRCRVCTNKVLLTGFNDLATRYPKLAVEFHAEANGVTADRALAGTSRSYFWKCPEYGHSWKDSISHRINDGVKCPVCAGRRVVEGANDVYTQYPGVLEWWDDAKNRDPIAVLKKYSIGTHKKFWWRCSHGHSFYGIPRNRVSNGCDTCVGRGFSRKEKDLFREVKKAYPNAKSGRWLTVDGLTYTKYRKVPYDIVLEDEKVAIEYDGYTWHRDTVERDVEKAVGLLNKDWLVIRVREKRLPPLPVSHPRYFEVFLETHRESMASVGERVLKVIDSYLIEVR